VLTRRTLLPWEKAGPLRVWPAPPVRPAGPGSQPWSASVCLRRRAGIEAGEPPRASSSTSNHLSSKDASVSLRESDRAADPPPLGE